MGHQAPSSSRKIAFAAIVFSTVAVTGCLLMFPMIFHYVQTLEASIQVEIDFCKARTRDMWREMLDVQSQTGVKNAKAGRFAKAFNNLRSRRAAPNTATGVKMWAERVANDDAPAAAGRPPPADLGQTSGGIIIKVCCTCHKGPNGPPGGPGVDGIDGYDGFDGQPGPRGEPAPGSFDHGTVAPFICPCEPAADGQPGGAGEKGKDGAGGEPGPNGLDGKAGDGGPRGPPGPPGPAGEAGAKGAPGDNGKQIPGKPGPPGNNGPPGKAGPGGSAGKGGDAGKDGPAGPPGPPGDGGPLGGNGKAGAIGTDGEPGKPGAVGSCEHCPPARLAPGY